MAWTTPRTWENGTPPTAAMFNTDIRDNTTELYNNTMNAANKWASTSTSYTNTTTNITIVRGAETSFETLATTQAIGKIRTMLVQEGT